MTIVQVLMMRPRDYACSGDGSTGASTITRGKARDGSQSASREATLRPLPKAQNMARREPDSGEKLLVQMLMGKLALLQFA